MTLSRTLLVAAAFSLAALCLAACVASPPDNPARSAVNPGELFILKAGPGTDQIALALHADGLSPDQETALRRLADRRRANAGGAIVLSAPHGVANPQLAARFEVAVHAILLVQGVREADIQSSTYESDDPKAPLLVSFSYVKAEVPTCGKHWDELTHTEDNNVQSNFGCAITANMAAQMAYPEDIIRPHTEDAPDVERRLTVLGKYADGKVTAADEKDDKAGIVSHVAP